MKALYEIKQDGLTIVDIGDSSGNHSAYVHALTPDQKVKKIVSVNLDPTAIEKVRAKGFEAIQCRAEELDLENINPDLFVSFETVEHLPDPLRFLHSLAERGGADHLLISVPYQRKSRFGGHHLRQQDDQMPEKSNHPVKTTVFCSVFVRRDRSIGALDLVFNDVA